MAVRFDRRRRIHYPLLCLQFALCVGTWVVAVPLLGGHITRPGLVASVITGVVLVGVTWVLAKSGIPPSPAHVTTLRAAELSEADEAEVDLTEAGAKARDARSTAPAG